MCFEAPPLFSLNGHAHIWRVERRGVRDFSQSENEEWFWEGGDDAIEGVVMEEGNSCLKMNVHAQ